MPTQYYATPVGNNTQGTYEFFKFIAIDTAGGIFFPVILLVIWVVAFMNLKQYSTSRAWTFASFLCAILSILLAVLDLISPKFMYLPIILTVIGLVWLKLED
jgi:hypothetical protein